jgi:hypothetical protein
MRCWMSGIARSPIATFKCLERSRGSLRNFAYVGHPRLGRNPLWCTCATGNARYTADSCKTLDSLLIKETRVVDFTMAGKGLTRWHITENGHISVCGSAIYTALVRAQNVEIEDRCKATACRGRWPDYRDQSDRTIMSSESDANSPASQP